MLRKDNFVGSKDIDGICSSRMLLSNILVCTTLGILSLISFVLEAFIGQVIRNYMECNFYNP